MPANIIQWGFFSFFALGAVGGIAYLAELLVARR